MLMYFQSGLARVWQGGHVPPDAWPAWPAPAASRAWGGVKGLARAYRAKTKRPSTTDHSSPPVGSRAVLQPPRRRCLAPCGPPSLPVRPNCPTQIRLVSSAPLVLRPLPSGLVNFHSKADPTRGPGLASVAQAHTPLLAKALGLGKPPRRSYNPRSAGSQPPLSWAGALR